MPDRSRVDSEDYEVGGARSGAVSRGRPTRRRGVAAVELALLLPLLAFIFVVGTDFARIFYVSLTLTNCARSGALYASDPSVADESPYTSVQHAALVDATDLSPPPVVTSTTGVDAAGVAYVQVTATAVFSTITNFPGVPQQLEVRRSVRMTMAPTKPNG